MATRRTNATDKAKEATKKTRKEVHGEYKILRAVEFDNGGISFDMEFNDITFYRLGIRKGQNGEFISYPSYKGSDGNYYHYYYLPLSDESQDKIIQLVYNKLDGEDSAE